MAFEIKPQALLNSLSKLETPDHPRQRSAKQSCMHLPILISARGKAYKPGEVRRAHTGEILVKFCTRSQCYCPLVAPLHTYFEGNFSRLSEALQGKTNQTNKKPNPSHHTKKHHTTALKGSQIYLFLLCLQNLLQSPRRNVKGRAGRCDGVLTAQGGVGMHMHVYVLSFGFQSLHLLFKAHLKYRIAELPLPSTPPSPERNLKPYLKLPYLVGDAIIGNALV